MKFSILNQYISECKNSLKHTAKVSNCFVKVFMDAMQLYMSIPDRVNFLQLGRYGKFTEQTYRNNFERAELDWIAFNSNLAGKVLSGKRKPLWFARLAVNNNLY